MIQRGVDIGYGVDTVRGNANHPVNRGMACSRGVGETADPDGTWLTRPLVRRDGQLVKTTWDTALFEACRGLGDAMADDPDAVAVLGSGQQTNEAAYALGKLARGGIGTRYYDANTTLCMASAVTAYYDAFGSDAPPPTYEDIPDVDGHVVWGANPSVAHPVLWRWVTDGAADGDLVVVDPVATRTAQAADHHVAVDPGGDLALARAVLAHVVETGGVDEAFVDAATTGVDDLKASLPDPAAAAERAGVTMAGVERLAGASSSGSPPTTPSRRGWAGSRSTTRRRTNSRIPRPTRGPTNRTSSRVRRVWSPPTPTRRRRRSNANVRQSTHDEQDRTADPRHRRLLLAFPMWFSTAAFGPSIGEFYVSDLRQRKGWWRRTPCSRRRGSTPRGSTG